MKMPPGQRVWLADVVRIDGQPPCPTADPECPAAAEGGADADVGRPGRDDAGAPRSRAGGRSECVGSYGCAGAAQGPSRGGCFGTIGTAAECVGSYGCA